MEEQIAKGLQRERMFATLCQGVGSLALVLSVIGLYGVISYSIYRRRSEIGIRLALGAVRKDVISMVLREGLGLAALGILAAIPVVWIGARYVEKLLSNMKPLEPLSFVVALGNLGAAAVAAVSVRQYAHRGWNQRTRCARTKCELINHAHQRPHARTILCIGTSCTRRCDTSDRKPHARYSCNGSSTLLS